VFDFRTDSPRVTDRTRAASDAALLFDGVFLLRPELRDEWDLTVFVCVEPEESLRRALDRDVDLFGSREEVERRYRARYLPGQRLYLDEARPLEHADLVIVNDDPAAPELSGR
jgi:uridine kinase